MQQVCEMQVQGYEASSVGQKKEYVFPVQEMALKGQQWV